jgi:hypothetical protein
MNELAAGIHIRGRRYDQSLPYFVTSARTSAVEWLPAKTVWKNRRVSERTIGASDTVSAMILAMAQLRKALCGRGYRAIMGVILILGYRVVSCE